jgi:hypothetical protein
VVNERNRGHCGDAWMKTHILETNCHFGILYEILA